MRPPSPNNKNGSNPMTNNERGTMRHPLPNNKNGSASMTFQMAIKIMEQYQQKRRESEMKFMEMFMKQQETFMEMQTKLLIEIIQRKNGRLNIDAIQLMNNSLPSPVAPYSYQLEEQNNVSETRTDDRNAATTTVKPVPRHWLDWVEKTKQNEQKRREERANDGTTNDLTEYIDGAKYEWKPGTIALTQTTDISTAFPASSNYFKCLEEDDNPTTVESTLSKEYNLQAQATVTQSRTQRVCEQQTKREIESVPEVSREENPAAWALATWTRSQRQEMRVNDQKTKKKVEFTPEVVTEVRTRPKFENEKALSQPKGEQIQNRRAAKHCKHLLEVKIKTMCDTKRPPPQRRLIKPSRVQRVTSAQEKKETTLALPNRTVQQTTLSINKLANDGSTRNLDERGKQSKVLLDSGANFWAFDQHDSKMKILDHHNPISALEPSGNAMKSMAEATYDHMLPMLPKGTSNGHVMPLGQGHSIAPCSKLVDAGCEILLGANDAKVFYKGNLILTGDRSNKMWFLNFPTTSIFDPLQQNATNASPHRVNNLSAGGAIYSVYQMGRVKEAISFLHAALGSPSSFNVKRAITGSTNLLSSWPVFGTNPKQAMQHLVDTFSTKLGNLRRIQSGCRSTKKRKQKEREAIARARILDIVRANEKELEEEVIPTEPEQKCNEVYFLIIDTENMMGTAFTDISGPLPYTSLRGYRYIFFTYSYDGNAIMMEAMKNREDGEMKRVYEKTYKRLEAAGIKPTINVMDNEASNAITTWLTNNEIQYQTVAPGAGGHRANRAERSIQTGVNHFLSTIATTDADFPIRAWCYTIEQMEITVNMLRPTNINPKISAFTILYGEWSYDAHPILPVGWRSLVFKDPADRRKYSYHGDEGFVVGVSKQGYRKVIFLITSTGQLRESNTYALWAPDQFTMPEVPTHEEVLLEASANLGRACQSVEWETATEQERKSVAAGLERLQMTIKGEADKIAGNINEPPRQQVSQRDELYNRPLTQIQHRYPTRSRQVNSIEQEKTSHIKTPKQSDPQRVSLTPTQPNTQTVTKEVETKGVQREHEQREQSEAIRQIYMHEKYGKPITNNRAKAMMTTSRKVKKESVAGHQKKLPDLNTKLDEAMKSKANKIRKETAKFTSTTLRSTSNKQNTRSSSLTTPTRTRARALNALLFSDSNPYKLPSPQEQTRVHELPPYYVNAILNEATGEVNIPAIIDTETNQINTIIDPVTGEQKEFRHLMKDESTKVVWDPAMSTEVDRLYDTGTIRFIPRSAVPQNKKVVYLKIVVDIREHKAVKERVRIVATPTAVGGGKVNYAGETTTRTVEVSTVKMHLQSVLSTPGAKYMTLDISDFYLATPMEEYEYGRLKVDYIPEATMKKYNLYDLVHNGYVYIEIRRGMYGLQQAGRLANEHLKRQLAPYGFYECEHTPGLWRHKTRPIVFTLWVDDYGVQYIDKKDVNYLLNALTFCKYKFKPDWKGTQYCGMTIEWDYNARTCTISVPGYIEKVLIRFQHQKPKRPQHSPFPAPAVQYGKSAQQLAPEDASPLLDKEGTKRIQEISGCLLWYARIVDNTLLKALNTIARKQSAPTELTNQWANQILDYCATNPDAKIQYQASDMQLKIHSDASYLNEPNARSSFAGYHFLGWNQKEGEPLKLNGCLDATVGILKLVAASAAESELGGLFTNAQKGKVFRLTLFEMGWPQKEPTPIFVDNSTAHGIANNTIKRQRSRAMNMRYFWVVDQVTQQIFKVHWAPGIQNLADYFTKHHMAAHHKKVRPYYLHCSNSPPVLANAPSPQRLRGCAKTSFGPYAKGMTPLAKPSQS